MYIYIYMLTYIYIYIYIYIYTLYCIETNSSACAKVLRKSLTQEGSKVLRRGRFRKGLTQGFGRSYARVLRKLTQALRILRKGSR